MIRRLLVANRGEIAVRVIRAARDLGVESVAVFSAADRDAYHTELADRAVCIGPAPAPDSYLHRDRLVHVAVASGCDAVHPGYGFLAEDAEFARKVRDAGLTWVGPAPETIALMGDKAAARARAEQASVPLVPGSGVLASVEEAAEFGARHGYPLLLKARAGGGGKGMRVVPDPDGLRAVFALAGQEAQSAFGDGGLYAERYLTEVRHVEVQVLGDAAGRVVVLGERDCSLQRRYQKVVEEAPASLPDGLRAELHDTAGRLARAVGYESAGTVEFLVDVAAARCYFIEMNTRIQVEHPVTEELTGVDLVAWQLRIAGGADLGALQVPGPTGHAIEFRITAEDPAHDFRPSPGRLELARLPAGPGVRCDTHCRSGDMVPPYYDSLLAKVVVRGRDRAEAIRRSRRALAELRIEGVATNAGLHRWLLDRPEMVEGTYTTGYLGEAMETYRKSLEVAV